MKVKKSELMFYTAYTMYYIMNMLYTTRIGNFLGVISLNDLSLIVTPIVLGCLLVTFLKSISRRYWFAFGMIFVAALAIAYNSGARAILISIMFILCARMIDLEVLCRFTFKMNTTMVLLVIVLPRHCANSSCVKECFFRRSRTFSPNFMLATFLWSSYRAVTMCNGICKYSI